MGYSGCLFLYIARRRQKLLKSIILVLVLYRLPGTRQREAEYGWVVRIGVPAYR